jgi:thioredoxin-like negative regulator of GroEL
MAAVAYGAWTWRDAQMQVTSLPTVMALSGRKVVDSFVGLLKPAEITKFVEGLLKDFARTRAPPHDVASAQTRACAHSRLWRL